MDNHNGPIMDTVNQFILTSQLRPKDQIETFSLKSPIVPDNLHTSNRTHT